MKKGQGCGGTLIRFIGILILLLLVGYNFWETARLRAEVAELRNALRSGAAKVSAPSSRDSVSGGNAGLLGEARHHAEQAEVFLRKKQYNEARREIALAATAARKTSDTARTQSAGALKELQSTVDALSRSARSLSETGSKLWKDSEDSAAEKEESKL